MPVTEPIRIIPAPEAPEKTLSNIQIDSVLFLEMGASEADLLVEWDRMGRVPGYRDVAEVVFPQGALPIPAFRHEQHRALAELWNEIQQPDRLVPLRESFDVMDLFGSVAHLTLVQEIDDGTDFHYRVQGSAIAHRHAREMTGKRMSDYGGGPALLHGPLYRRVIDERRPIYCEHSIPSPSGETVQRWSRICVPLLGPKDGAHFVLNSAVNTELDIVQR